MKILIPFILLHIVGFINCDYYGMGFPANGPTLVREPYVYKKVPLHFLSATQSLGYTGFNGGDGLVRKHFGSTPPYHHTGHYQSNYSFHYPKGSVNGGETGSQHDSSNHSHESNRSPQLFGVRVNSLSWLRRPFRKGVLGRILG